MRIDEEHEKMSIIVEWCTPLKLRDHFKFNSLKKKKKEMCVDALKFTL